MMRENDVADFQVGSVRVRFVQAQPEVELPQHPTITAAPQRQENPYRQLLGELPKWPKE